MKSAEEWQSEIGLEPLEFDEVAKLIRSVQTDALKAAAEKCEAQKIVGADNQLHKGFNHGLDEAKAVLKSLIPEE